MQYCITRTVCIVSVSCFLVSKYSFKKNPNKTEKQKQKQNKNKIQNTLDI